MSKLNVKRLNRLLTMMFYQIRFLDDEDRDLPIKWSMMHMYSSSQIAKLVALKRGMDMEQAAICAALHDIAAIVTKKKEKHAESAEPYVREMIHRFNTENEESFPKITEEETNYIVHAIVQHSDKETYTEDRFVELLKDVDSLDRYLHGIQSDGAYLERSLRVLKELGIN